MVNEGQYWSGGDVHLGKHEMAIELFGRQMLVSQNAPTFLPFLERSFARLQEYRKTVRQDKIA